MLTIAMVKTRPHYDHTYVNRLAKAVQRNITIPHKIVCLTDDPRGVAVECKTLPARLGGWWGKIALFKAGMLRPPVLYLDLDTVICGNLDFVADYKGDFAILRDFYRDDGFGSGVMMWNRDNHQVWDKWDRTGRPTHPLGDQGWMEIMMPDADILQEVFPDKLVSYKVHCEGGLPKNAAICCFHGVPKPHDFPDGHWVNDLWTS